MQFTTPGSPGLHCVLEKKDQQYIGHSFDQFKYTVIISRKEYREGYVKILT